MTRAIVAATLLVITAPAAAAQRLQPEIRFETIGPAYHALVGVGVNVPVGRYVRVGLGGTGFAVGRTDLIARFTFDPYRQARWAFAAGGGVSYDVGLKEPFLALHVELEGPKMRRVTPFVSAGLAGGARFAAGMRRAFPNRR